jgi:hypothetical protein
MKKEWLAENIRRESPAGRVAVLENSVLVIDYLAAFAIWNAKRLRPERKMNPRICRAVSPQVWPIARPGSSRVLNI